MLCSDLNGKERQKGGDIRVCTADSLCSTVETNTTLHPQHLGANKTSTKNAYILNE